MIDIKFYCLPNNHRIQSDLVPIFKDKESLEKSIERQMKNITLKSSLSFSMFINSDMVTDKTQRAEILIKIHDSIDEDTKTYLQLNPDELQIKYYFITPDGKCLIVNDFDKILSNVNIIEERCVNTIKENDKKNIESIIELRDRMINLRNNSNTTKDILIATTVLAYVYQIIDEDIENHRKEIQENLFTSIKQYRQEEADEIRNELDILNMHIKNILKTPEERNNLEFIKCTYNDEEITQEEMLDRLRTHIIPKYLVKQVDIRDTLEDEYIIETNNLRIIREKGGKIRMFNTGLYNKKE